MAVDPNAVAWAGKDIFTISIASAALLLTLWNTWKSRLDRRQDGLRVVRSQLTDTLQNISETRAARKEVNNAPGDTEEVWLKKRSTRGTLHDRLRFLCHQAMFLSRQIPEQVASIEYALVGMAYEDFGEHTSAEEAHRMAVRSAKSPKERAFALRALGRVQFELEQPNDGRAEYASAVHVLEQESTNDLRQQLVETLLRWAESESSLGEQARVPNLLAKVVEVAQTITHPGRKQDALRDISVRRKTLLARLAPPESKTHMIPDNPTVVTSSEGSKS